MSMQTILFVHHANDMYGADVGLLHSLQSLDRERYYPIVILPADMPPPGRLSTELDRLEIEYHVAPLGILRRKYLSLRTIVPLAWELVNGALYVRQMAQTRRAAMVYVNTMVAVSGGIGGWLARVPVLWHVREILALPRPIRSVLLTTLGTCATRIVCISRAVRDSMLAEAPRLAEKITVVYNAVSPDRGTSSGTSLREELGVPREAPLVGMIGRVSHWKGQEVLVDAAPILLKNHPAAQFVAVGGYFADESHYLEGLKCRIERHGLKGKFHLLDYRAGVGEIYAALNVFVLASTKPEPFGRVTVEAMMHGLPVVATNHGGTPELIEDGATGMLVPPADPEALAAAIEQLLINPALASSMGKAAARYARDNFDLSRYQGGIREVIDQLVVNGFAEVPAFARVLTEIETEAQGADSKA